MDYMGVFLLSMIVTFFIGCLVLMMVAYSGDPYAETDE